MIAVAGSTPPGSSSADPTCAEGAGALCDAVVRATDNEVLAEVVDLVAIKGLHLLIVAGLAWLATRLVNRAIAHLVERVLRSAFVRSSVPADRAGIAPEVSKALTGRAAQRGEIIGSVLHSAAGFAIWTTATIMAIGELGINLGPLVAGAGIAGVALGFGAQSLVRDVLAGLFILFEDQFAMGDDIDVAEVSGKVEGFTLRVTKLRDETNRIWYVPNGEIRRVGNRSQSPQGNPPPS